jgi:hypothetical protein
LEAGRLGRWELVLGLVGDSSGRQHRLLEQLQRELAFTTGTAGNAESAAVGFKVGSDPDGVFAVMAGFDLPAK